MKTQRILSSVLIFAVIFGLMTWRYNAGFAEGRALGVHEAVQGLADAGRICDVAPKQ